MRSFSPLREPWPRIIGIPLLGLCLGLIYNHPPNGAWHILVSVGVTGLVWQGDYMLMMALRKRFPGVAETWKRITFSILSLTVYNIAVDVVICSILIKYGLQNNEYLANSFWARTALNMGIALFVATIYEAGYFFRRWKEQAVETEILKSRQLRTELDVLKNQVSPHFLFNSLNTLVALIHEDPHQAERFTRDLSAVYRYILQHKDKEVVDLGTELDFTGAYINLMKVRFEDSLQIDVQVPPEHHHLLVAPLTLQLLLENALKHNVASVGNPLKVDIHVESGRSLVVRNTLRRKQGVVDGTGTGLANVKQRYAYLSDRPVDVIETREHFMVALPLIELALPRQAGTQSARVR